MELSINVVVMTIMDIIKNNLEKVELWYYNQGGWEGWLQAELYYQLSRDFPTAREMKYPITDWDMYCDLYVRDENDEMYIELKADTQETHRNMKDLYREDIEKLEGVRGIRGFAILVSKIDYRQHLGGIKVCPCNTGLISDYLINVYPGTDELTV